jgi:hypothetical protein
LYCGGSHPDRRFGYCGTETIVVTTSCKARLCTTTPQIGAISSYFPQIHKAGGLAELGILSRDIVHALGARARQVNTHSGRYMKLSRALTAGLLVPWFAVSCITGEDPQSPAGSQGGHAANVGGNSNIIIGNQGGTRQATPTSNTKSTGVGGRTTASTSSVISGDTGGARVTSTGGQSAGIGGDTTVAVGGVTGAGGTLSTSTAAPPTSGLGVCIDTKQSGGIKVEATTLYISVDIVNTANTTQNMAPVTMRYWYADESWGSSTLVMETSWVSIGNSNTGGGTVKYGGSFPVSPAQVGADHYFEFSFTGTLAATGDSQSNDKFHVQVRIHDSSYAKSADVSNDYSVMTTTGCDDRITLYSGGTLIWGKEPGSSTLGTGGAPSIGGASSMGGTSSGVGSSAGGTLGTGGVESGGGANTGGVTTSGGDTGTGGLSSTGGLPNSGGDSSTGGVASGGEPNTGGVANTGGLTSTGGIAATGGVPTTGGESGIAGDAGFDLDASVDSGIF